MEPKQDFWFWLSVTVSVVATFFWALSITLNIGGIWVTLVAATVVIAALGSQGVRAGLQARGMVWTEEMKEAQRRRARQRSINGIPTIALGLAVFVPISLVRAGVLPMWVGDLLFLAMLAGCYWLWRVIRQKGGI